MFSDFYRQPPTAERVARATEWLTGRYGALKVFPIGRSVLGRDINAFCIGSPVGATVFVGATHGLEWLTTLTLIRFCERLLDGLESGGRISNVSVRNILRSRSLVIIPCLNPDGVEIALRGREGAGELADSVEEICGGDYSRWQANANGVDLNHNFDAGWQQLREMEIASGIDAPAPTRYGGSHPNSEPETVAMTTFCLTCQPGALYSFHSQGEEIYYRYGEFTPPRSQMMARILATSSGYEVAHPEGLASHGGLKDWFIEKFRRPGFTIEIGRGKNPLSIRQFEKIYAKIEEMLVIAALF